MPTTAEHAERIAEIRAKCARWRAMKDAVDAAADAGLSPYQRRCAYGVLRRRLRIIERLAAKLGEDMGMGTRIAVR